MLLPSLPTVIRRDACICGDVTVSDRATISPGAVLQAAPGSRIVIGDGACIGAGAVLSACGGTIAIETGAMLGAGVLVFGWGTIGKYACIGTAATIYQTDVAATVAIAAGQIFGDPTLPNSNPAQPPAAADEAEDAPAARAEEPPPSPPAAATDSNDAEASDADKATDTKSSATNARAEGNGSATRNGHIDVTIYGRSYVESLISTIFPHRNQP
ncbi:carbonic anhydrase/acetyltransferase, isoleucine patch superfamily [Rubidibacter lacunae KORDI 51-2]|uniref:Carbonic anhydrase/acetyltransferase, isoleucine patch superfamily n=1 Tax=Rubidibacter lacunae KORDI 51-2 TaxID=582515 RepID=U5DNY6_9CHRO|nr:carbonic anhydrase/acetyltransferase, isoleucine patch superfamily [Rubidibacter lacunae]ERN41420.1 carbonic anhydrase/acetyltransferase, isoleucine patch superfamily [Rubidibacter lacunae KORDI 51-2]